jgi:excisionase family DNA binding protein
MDSQLFEIYVTKKQLAESLSLSSSFINKLMAKEGLPYRQIGRAVRFSVKEVAEWLQKRSRP